MRAILQSDYGPRPEDVLRLGRLNAPALEDDEVLVRVHAASVDRGTWHVARDGRAPLSHSPRGVQMK